MSKNLSYHGKTKEQAQWVVDYFSEMSEYYKDNQSFLTWMTDSLDVLLENDS